MVVGNSKMRVFIFLLVGIVACFPKGGLAQPKWMYSTSPFEGSQGLPENPSGSSGPYYYSSGSPPTGGAGSSFSSGAQQYSTQDSQPGTLGSHPQYTQESWGSSDADGDKEPVFTPVNAEDQVYAHKSRSQYKKSNLRFYQFVYIPTEPVEHQEPIYPHYEKMPQHSKGQVHKGF